MNPLNHTPDLPDAGRLTEPEPHQGFFKKHYGNPEHGEIYGVTANDYETEPEQIKDERKSAGQAIWFVLALGLVTFLAYTIESW